MTGFVVQGHIRVVKYYVKLNIKFILKVSIINVKKNLHKHSQ